MACAAIIITVNNLNVVVCGAQSFPWSTVLFHCRSSWEDGVPVLLFFFFACVSFKHNFQFVLIKFQTKMAEIQIHVDPMEEEAFLRAYSDVAFPPLGMTCPVRSCPDIQLFTCYGEYLKHYSERHRPFVHRFGCNTCERRFRVKKNKRAHKFCGGQKATFFLYHVSNINFIDPMGVRVPRPPSTPRGSIDLLSCQFISHKRAELARKRRDYSDYCQSQLSQAEIMENFEASLK